MKSKEIYQSIDQTKLKKVEGGEKAIANLKRVEKETKGFTVENPKFDVAMGRLYDVLKEKNPQVLKNVKVEEKVKEVKVPTTKKEQKKDPKKKTKTVKKKVKKATGKKKVSKPTKTPSTPKERKVPFSTRAKQLADKEGISFKEARAKLSKQIKEESKKIEKSVKSDLDKLLAFVKSKKFEDGEKYPKTYGQQNPQTSNVSADAKRMAKPVGKRKSKNGKTYYEYRDNRSDRNSLPAPQGKYKYKGETPPYLEAGGTLPTPFGQAGLVGETGAMNEMDMFAMGGDLPQGVHQYYSNTYNPAYPTPHGYAKGGKLDVTKEFFTVRALDKNYNSIPYNSVYTLKSQSDAINQAKKWYSKGLEPKPNSNKRRKVGLVEIERTRFYGERFEDRNLINRYPKEKTDIIFRVSDEYPLGERVVESPNVTNNSYAKGGVLSKAKVGDKVKLIKGSGSDTIFRNFPNGVYEVKKVKKGSKSVPEGFYEIENKDGNKTQLATSRFETKMAKGGLTKDGKYFKNKDISELTTIKEIKEYKGLDNERKTKTINNGIILIDNAEQIEYYFKKVSPTKYEFDYEEEFEDFDFAKGGALSKEFKFDKNFIIYVPSTSNVGKPISKSELDKRVNEVEKFVANKFGGYTETETDGGYKSNSGKIIEEDIVKVSVFAKAMDWLKNESSVISKVRSWAKKWGQEAIGFEYEGDLYYVSENKLMKNGGVIDAFNLQFIKDVPKTNLKVEQIDNKISYAKGGKVRKSPFKVGDMVYSYQNPNHKMRVSFVEDRGVEDGVDYGWGYKVALKTDEDGKYDPKGKYSKSSKWMSQNSVSKTKKTKYAKGGKTQGYNDKLDESLGNTKGKRSSKEQNYKDRRNESEAMEKKKGKRKYSRVKTMDKGSRKLKKPNSFFAVVKRKQKKGEAWKDAIQRVKNEMKK